jgi:hypothetical protein
MANERTDDLVTRLTESLYHASSRRGFLSTLGKGLMGLLGMSVLDALPLDRTVQIAEASPAETHVPTRCDYWKYCSINTGGWTVCRCCQQVTQDCLCPYGTLPGTSYWVGCCMGNGNPRTLMRYYDCCRSLDPSQVQCTKTCNIQCHRHDNANGVTEQQTHTSGGSGSYYHLAIWCVGTPTQEVVCTTVCSGGSC